MQRNNANYDYVYKYITIGDSGVGKSSLSAQYVDNRFSREYDVTIGVEFSQKTIVAKDGTRIKIQIWDTAGQEKFRSITVSYYRGVGCALIVYDISSRSSFESVPSWLEDIKKLAPPNIVIVLVGNKTDKENQRRVLRTEGAEFAKENKLLFFESSAKNYESVNNIFAQSVDTINDLIKCNKISADKSKGIGKQNVAPVYIESNKKTTDRCGWCSIL